MMNGRTVIVTGAGSGLGRAHAMALAEAGANVVVNDINERTAAETVAMIEKAGGSAKGDTRSIIDYAASGEMVTEAISDFGGLHAVVNNAGNNRDRMFVSLSEDDWDSVIAVHLKGHFCISSHAAKYWRGLAKEGQDPKARIINTTSGAGLNGSVGQSNYAAAKAGIAALTLNQSAELGRYGIMANCIAPQGRTGMTEGVFDDMMKAPDDGGFDVFDPANVSPLVVYLCSEVSDGVTGHCFEAFGGKVALANGWKTGTWKDKGARYAADEVGRVVRDLIATEPPAQKVYGT